MSRAEYDEMTPAETGALRRETEQLLDGELKIQVELVKGLARALTPRR
jgi:hypothetical protein